MRNDQLPSNDGHVTLKHVSMFKIQHKKTQAKTLNIFKLFTENLPTINFLV